MECHTLYFTLLYPHFGWQYRFSCTANQPWRVRLLKPFAIVMSLSVTIGKRTCKYEKLCELPKKLQIRRCLSKNENQTQTGVPGYFFRIFSKKNLEVGLSKLPKKWQITRIKKKVGLCELLKKLQIGRSEKERELDSDWRPRIFNL